MTTEAQDILFGILVFATFAAHATVSYRDTSWLPRWLGQGCKPEDFSVHLRVAYCNAYYGALLTWLAWVRIDSPHWLLVLGFSMGATFTYTYAFVRGKLAIKKLIFYKNIRRLYQGA